MSELKERLRAIVAEWGEVDEVPDETPFSELGIDSMIALEIVSEVEREYKVSVEEQELQSLTHFSSVYEQFRSKIEPA